MYDNAELERLMVDAVRTLRDAQMHEALRAFDTRVLSRRPADLFEPSEAGEDAQVFKPMVELLLRELVALSSNPSLPLDQRHALALEAMELAGF